MIVVLDNYDSFTYNLVQIVGTLVSEVRVFRNDAITVDELDQLRPHGIIISPGPGRPEDAGISMEVIRVLGDRIPILGVCLGHQAIGAVYGASIVHAPELVHGKTSKIYHTNHFLFHNMDNPFEAGRYHSLVIDKNSLPPGLRVIATTSDGTIMAVEHEKYPVFGIQFHPESILTPAGPTILANWVGGLYQ
ncbi:MAG: aminodeoxychorismate/anthranilate synthase component II [Bacteroidetes bacterium]|nr:aminodeoxychorismate/anthranilate synthase component II [Bacteroidota bacterium]